MEFLIDFLFELLFLADCGFDKQSARGSDLNVIDGYYRLLYRPTNYGTDLGFKSG
jgi:hypothetical protein